jgi:hypothetical protein
MAYSTVRRGVRKEKVARAALGGRGSNLVRKAGQALPRAACAFGTVPGPENMRRILIVGGAAVLTIVVFGQFVLLPALGRAAARAVQERGSELTQTAVRVAGAEVDLARRRAVLSDLRVANPEGFRSEHALSVERVALTVEAAALGADPLVLEEVVIEAPTLVYEFGPDGNNIAVLRRRIQAQVAREEERARGGGDAPVPLVIESLRVTHGKVRILSHFLGGQEIVGRLPDIQLKGIGATVGTSVGKVVQEVLATVAKGLRANLKSLDLRGGDVRPGRAR